MLFPRGNPHLTIACRTWLDSSAWGLVVLLRFCARIDRPQKPQPSKTKEDNMPKRVVIIPGDDAAPEAMTPTVDILKSFNLDITWTEFPSGEEGVKQYGSRQAFDRALREAINQSDTTLFGSTNGTTGGLNHLRWGKRTFANVRP